MLDWVEFRERFHHFVSSSMFWLTPKNTQKFSRFFEKKISIFSCSLHSNENIEILLSSSTLMSLFLLFHPILSSMLFVFLPKFSFFAYSIFNDVKFSMILTIFEYSIFPPSRIRADIRTVEQQRLKFLPPCQLYFHARLQSQKQFLLLLYEIYWNFCCHDEEKLDLPLFFVQLSPTSNVSVSDMTRRWCKQTFLFFQYSFNSYEFCTL